MKKLLYLYFSLLPLLSIAQNGNRKWGFENGYLTPAQVVKINLKDSARSTGFYAHSPSGYLSNINSIIGENNWITKRYFDSVGVKFSDSLSRISFDGTTSDNTPLSLNTIYIPSGNQATIEVTINAHNTLNNEVLAGKKIVTIKNIGGTYTMVGSVQTIYADQSESSVSAASWTITITGGVPVIEVTGVSGTTINWRATHSKIYQPLTFT